MFFRQYYSPMGPSKTPPVLKGLIFLIASIAIFSALTNRIFTEWFHLVSPQDFLGLSLFGFKHGNFWQPLTYLFVQDTSSGGAGIYFLIGLFFNLYILWILGATLYERIGVSHFLTIFFLCGIVSGLLALSVMEIEGSYQILRGASSAILGVFTVWTMLNPKGEIWLFSLFPIRTRWLLGVILTFVVVFGFIELNISSIIFYLSAALIGYLYGVLVLGLKGPFEHTAFFENWIKDMKERFSSNKTNKSSSKIYDFSTGEPLMNDDEFVDAMLTKISKSGEKSLSQSEQKRMKEISERRRKR